MTEEPLRERISKWYKQNRQDVNLSIFLFTISFLLKTSLYFMIGPYFNDSFEFTKTGGIAGVVRVVLFSNSTKTLPWQGFTDLWYFYIPYVDAFSHGWNPYTPLGLPNDPISGIYNYGPLYIFFISIGTVFFSMDPLYSILFSNILFDSLSVVVCYLIARQYKDHMSSFLVALTIMLSPAMLYYIDFKMLDIPQMLFFVLLFIYFAIREKTTAAVISLSFGFMTKLIPILILPLYLVYLIRIYGRKKAQEQTAIFLFNSLILGIPTVYQHPVLFFQRLLNVGETPDNAINQNLLSFTILDNLGFFLILIIYLLILYSNSEVINKDKVLHILFYTGYLIGVHLTFTPLVSRGYKYYDTLFLPLLILVYFILLSKSKLRVKFGKVSCALLFILGVHLLNVAILNLPYEQTRNLHKTFLLALFLFLTLMINNNIRQTSSDEG